MIALTLALAVAATPTWLAPLPELQPRLEALYRELHRNPELSGQEARTAAALATRLRALGFDVTTGVGGHGIVGVLRNGGGRTILLRTELDALPVKEETGLPFASTVTAKNPAGVTVPVMHACGHDAHMTAWLGAATLLAAARSAWRGTLVVIGQPAEETTSGAKAMLADGLLTRFPRPDAALALHVTPSLPADRISARTGPIYAMNDGVELVVHGRGGHGAKPQETIDPVLLASRVVVALQGIVAREVNPLDPAVITVGSIHGGTKGNIIPDDVTLQLTVRSYRPEVQQALLAAIARVAKGEAVASGAPREPTATVIPGAPVTVNDPAVAAAVRAAIARTLGPEAVDELPPTATSEDFSELGKAGVPSTVIFVGASPSAATAEAARRGAAPGVHSARFAPDLAPTLRTAVVAFTASAVELFGMPDGALPSASAAPSSGNTAPR